MDIIIGLLIGNILAVLSWTFITTPVAVDTRLSLYTYLKKIAGRKMSWLYDWANVIIFTVISAAMITVSATAVRCAFDIPAQLNWYPTNPWFVLIVIAVGLFAVFVAIYGFKFTIIVYTLLAGRFGAKASYPEAEAKEAAFNASVSEYYARLATEEPKVHNDDSAFSKALSGIGYLALAITLVLAALVLFGCADEAEYLANRDTFYTYGFVCTLVYFITACWAFQRGKAIAKA